MSNKIQVRRSSNSGQRPTNTQIDLGEFAINTADGQVFIRDGAGNVILVNPLTEAQATNLGQYTVARVLDDVGLDGTTGPFGLSYNSGTALTYGDINLTEIGRLMIAVGGQVQSPGAGQSYNIGSGTATDQVQITFTEAPENGSSFFGTVQARQANAIPGVSEELAIAYAVALG